MRNHLWMALIVCMTLVVPAHAEEVTKVRMVTTLGDVEITLDKQHAPNTVANFLSYVKEGFYNGTIFHRVIPNFMIQGGGFTPDLNQKKAHAPIDNEADNGLRNEVGTIAMARTSDPDSATSQFFINTRNNSFLNFRNHTRAGWGYTVFGKVSKGMDVVRRIEAVQTGSRGFMKDVPVKPVVIEKVEVIH